MRSALVGTALLTLASASVWADGGVTFQDIATDPESGLIYRRTESSTTDIYREITERPFFSLFDISEQPNKWRGAPGVALLDYDGDGDLDIYATNGPATANSLFSNQLVETGATRFLDVGVEAGVGAIDQDSSGVCFGDIDNDGDPDLLVVSAFDPNRLFENNGDGTFSDITGTSGITKMSQTSAGCSFGDINGDGLLDVVVNNTNLDWSSVIGIGPEVPFGASWHNQLYLNTGGNVFIDVSASSGIENLVGFPEGFDGFPSVTWAVTMVDYDLDGDTDILQADDGGPERGFNHPLRNDGTGHFVDEVLTSGLHQNGHWMGYGIADFNSDGYLDFFGTNVGDWNITVFTPLDPVYFPFGEYELGSKSSRWFLGGPDGTFTDPGLGDLVATPFAWGTSAADYDNDGDTDIINHGGLSFAPFIATNPGQILQNDGSANFTQDFAALADSTNHARRNVHGMATGDLNGDGFIDIVSVSSLDIQESLPVVPYNVEWGSPLDGLIVYQQLFVPTETPGVWVYSGADENVDGSLSVELSSADNQNGWVEVKLLGSAGILDAEDSDSDSDSDSGADFDRVVNRDAIGAVVSFTPLGGSTAMLPILGGSSYASQDALAANFGLGASPSGTIEVLWPGGDRNCLHDAAASGRVLFPHLPCSFDGAWKNFGQYNSCVQRALDKYGERGQLTSTERRRLRDSARRAFETGACGNDSVDD